MERKFASKLNQLKVPAAEARKQASTQLKETIQMVKKINLISSFREFVNFF